MSSVYFMVLFNIKRKSAGYVFLGSTVISGKLQALLSTVNTTLATLTPYVYRSKLSMPSLWLIFSTISFGNIKYDPTPTAAVDSRLSLSLTVKESMPVIFLTFFKYVAYLLTSLFRVEVVVVIQPAEPSELSPVNSW